MNKACIFDSNKQCSKCSECFSCDITSGKKCNNCGKCLELEGYDVKAIKIDEIIDEDEAEEITEPVDNQENNKCTEENLKENLDNVDTSESIDWELIEDIEELKDILNDGEITNPNAHEAFPGLIVIDSKNK